jgi:hypothetical protein
MNLQYGQNEEVTFTCTFVYDDYILTRSSNITNN